MNIYREHKNTIMRKYIPYLVISIVALFVILLSSTIMSSVLFHRHNLHSDCLVSFGNYHGHKYKTEDTVGDGRCLVQSKWMQVMQHNVKIDNKNIIDDWLFIDYHDRINVIVEDPLKVGTNGETHFLLFRQTKYALEGRMSLAIVGGIIEPNENAKDAAYREVSEELGLDCNFEFLGRFRTDVNRGMGWVNSFIAHSCTTKKNGIDGNNNNIGIQPIEEVGAADTEKQDVVSLSIDEVKSNVRKGEFLEVQWSNTVALAMLHERYNQ